MKESAFSRRLRDVLEKAGFMCERIESHDTCPGCPDIFWHHTESAISGWIETKILEGMEDHLDYRPKQIPLMERWWAAGVNVCTVAYCHGNGAAILIPGPRVRESGKDISDIVTCDGLLFDAEFLEGIGDALLRLDIMEKKPLDPRRP